MIRITTFFSAPIKSAVKNLGPTLLQMSGPSGSSNSGAINQISLIGSNSAIMVTENDRCRTPTPRSRPGSSDGSTTVSVPSSPNMDHQQEHDEIDMKNNRIPEMAFKTVDEIYRRESLPQPVPVPQQQQPSAIPAHFQQQNSTSSSSNGHHDELTPRKKPRKQQMYVWLMSCLCSELLMFFLCSHSNEVTPAKKFQAPPETGSYSSDASKAPAHNVRSNKENSKPVQIYIKKPRTCTLLDVSIEIDQFLAYQATFIISLHKQSYKQNWKAASNHFQRYTDVKPRDERGTTVMDLANQSSVLQKVNGWKIYHLQSQMEDLVSVILLLFLNTSLITEFLLV